MSIKRLIVGAYLWLSDKYEDIRADLAGENQVRQCPVCEKFYRSGGMPICDHCQHWDRDDRK